MNPCSISGHKTRHNHGTKNMKVVLTTEWQRLWQRTFVLKHCREPTITETTPFEPFNFKHLWRIIPTPEPWTTLKDQTNTEESFQTTLKLSAPAERFFDALLGQRWPEEPVNKASAKMTEKNDTAPKGIPEVRGGKITHFSGKREVLKKFLETIRLHLLLNKIKNDEKRIMFTLTYMEGGDANSKRAFFLKKSVTTYGEPEFGTWKDFFETALR